jgi:hypothetical protein
MTHVERLREQAKELRILAESFGLVDICEQLTKLAERCEALAAAKAFVERFACGLAVVQRLERSPS